MTFEILFQVAMSNDDTPYPYQQRLAEEPWPDLLDIPTGLGKTAAVALAWAFKRGLRSGGQFVDPDPDTPRRLVWCLPMRVLVEQTRVNIEQWLTNLGHKKEDDKGIGVHVLMGGEERTDWIMHPERNMILIGTQDMLISRALNRGYAAGRARWPMDFGLLNNDCLWVYDEVQLMSTGLATSLQLDAWRKQLHLRGSDGFPTATKAPVARPCHSLWISATMARHWLDSAVDWKPRAESTWQDRHCLTDEDHRHNRVAALFSVGKTIDGTQAVAMLAKPDKTDDSAKTREYIEKLAQVIRDGLSLEGLTLVILNTVERATQLHRELADLAPLLIHSRFRPMERELWRKIFETKERKPRLIIATQVVEAGVDISAEVMFTELAPWASLVQRFGRCARYPGESGRVYWMDVSRDESTARPYSQQELTEAKRQLTGLTDVGLESLATIKVKLDQPANTARAASLFPYEPRFVPREKDLFDLFDTTPDLTGADVDISRYIRDDQEMDIQVFWRDVGPDQRPDNRLRPNRRELCPVAFYRFREQMAGLGKHGHMWRWSYREGWIRMTRDDQESVYPGQVFLLERSCGGYQPGQGWTGKPEDTDFRVLSGTVEDNLATKLDENDAEDSGDPLSSLAGWVKLSEHSLHVFKHMDALGRELLKDASDREINNLAARWHDRGKAHPAFVANMKPGHLEQARDWLEGEPAAKAPDGRRPDSRERDPDKDAWRRDKPKPGDSEDKRRPCFRHELASALAILETLRSVQPDHKAFAWPGGLNRQNFDCPEQTTDAPREENPNPLVVELAGLSKEEFDRLLYLVASHHGKVRLSLRGTADDARTDVPDPCPPHLRQARGVRNSDLLRACKLPDKDGQPVNVPAVELDLDPIELGLSCRYGPSWRDRAQNLLETLGPFRLGYLEALLRIADWRASAEEDAHARNKPQLLIRQRLEQLTHPGESEP